jgi:hypothetical protein
VPPITLHMVVARRVGRDLEAPALLAEEGAYLLGATTPDIRVITRQDRLSTHFFDLGVHEHQDSVGSFLESHAELARPEALNERTRAFVAGYLSHLAMDEEYITGVYRPFFGDHDALGGRIRANVMDRLLQFDLERRLADDPELKRDICAALAGTVEGIEIGFIDTETLERWRQVTVDVAQRNIDWERARGMISNHLRYSGLKEGETLTSFLDSLPGLLEETVAHITEAEVEGLVERSADVARRAIERYLGCA